MLSISWLLAVRGQSPAWLMYATIGASVFAVTLLVPSYLLAVEYGVLGGIGGSRGEAIDIALGRLLTGQYPYAAVTSDGQPLTPLPGNLLLAIPAKVGLGSAAFVSSYLIPIGILLVFLVNRPAAAIGAISVVAAPALWGDYLSGGDLVATSFLAFAVGLLVLTSASRDEGISRWIWPLLLGVVGATRVTTMVVAALVAALVINGGRTRVALVQLCESLGVFFVLSFPFYLWNPDEFSPLHVSQFARNELGVLLVLLATAVLFVWLARSKWIARATQPAALALACSIFAFLVTALPMLASLDTRANAGELLAGYAVLSLTAPIVVLTVRRSSSTVPASFDSQV